MARETTWGIAGLGRIAGAMAWPLQNVVPGARLLAVASRCLERAETFGSQYGAERRYSSYEEMADDSDVQAVYIATRNPDHAPLARLYLDAGKSVLVEKPFTLNRAEAEDIFALAREQGLLCMEAMWMRFIPLMRRVHELAAAGRLGALRLVQADFGFRTEYDPASRSFDPLLGGGALLDVGVYTISLAVRLLGPPDEVGGEAVLAPTGVDQSGAIHMRHGSHGLSHLFFSNRLETPSEAVIFGTSGSLRIPPRWWHKPSRAILRDGDGTETVIEEPCEENGYQYQAIEFQRCLHEGLSESEIMPIDDTLTVMGIMDSLRAQWGVTYPGEDGT